MTISRVAMAVIRLADRGHLPGENTRRVWPTEHWDNLVGQQITEMIHFEATQPEHWQHIHCKQN